ncbi:cytochrome c oxidase subunit II [Rubellicoccus peritrichatus]|uniref:cytochrome-c oxidase n=1 Tax=Rubellicoccus peritrichatus TaxID=3080537 RepID=A0AAQ3L7U1_9BACT|nr:cytochrome c oxidase subunit II [Puniceicoccus sp. CR14]WOO39474.1 cytochrome c oxidase subunit II [Puniceicoccus sp. CR14]
MVSDKRFTSFSSLLTGALITLLSLILGGCSFATRQSTLDPKGPVAHVQNDLFWVTVYVCCAIFVIVAAALFYAVWKFRERPGDENKPMPEQGHGNPLIEIGLIGGSIFLLVIIAIPTLDAIWYTHELPTDTEGYEKSKLGVWYGGDIAKDERDNILEINVYGWQWWWSFEYPQLGITTANEMVIPVGKVIKLNLRSEDVIHSFWLPKIAGKVDLMPGRQNWMWIQADETGHYYGQCAEFCGEAHAYMLFRSDVMTDEDFTNWVKDYQAGADAPEGFAMQPDKDKPDPTAQDDWTAWSKAVRKNPESLPDSAIHEGAALFMGKGQCIVCHAIDNSPAQGQSAPNLTKLAQRKSLAAGIMDNMDDNGEIDPDKQLDNITNWLARSQDYKPGNLMYYRADAGLRNLKYTGVTYSKLQKVGIGKEQFIKAGVKQVLADEIAKNPNEDVTSVTAYVLKKRGLDSVELGKISGLAEEAGSHDSASALTFADIKQLGLDTEDITGLGIPQELVAAMAQSPDKRISKIKADVPVPLKLTRNQLIRTTEDLTDDQFSEVSNWPSREDYRKIAMFLQTLK